MIKKIEDFISKKVEKGLYSGCQVLIARKGDIKVDLSLGLVDKNSNRQGYKVDRNTLFNIESITKVMVTLPIVFKLIEDGIIRLDDRIVKYIPEFATSDEKEKITIRNLLNFTSGIPLEDPVGCEEPASKKDFKKAWDLHFRKN